LGDHSIGQSRRLMVDSTFVGQDWIYDQVINLHIH